MAMLNREELIWASGLFEGEGCITIARHSRNGQYRRYFYPQMHLSMTDGDSVKRFAAAVGVGTIYTPKKQFPHHKGQWRWQVTGFEKCQAVIVALWNGLGRRRKSRAKEVLSLDYYKGPGT